MNPLGFGKTAKLGMRMPSPAPNVPMAAKSRSVATAKRDLCRLAAVPALARKVDKRLILLKLWTEQFVIETPLKALQAQIGFSSAPGRVGQLLQNYAGSEPRTMHRD
jgi:hypothetical protein